MNKYFSKLKSLYDNIMKILKRSKNDTEKFTFVLVTSKKERFYQMKNLKS